MMDKQKMFVHHHERLGFMDPINEKEEGFLYGVLFGVGSFFFIHQMIIALFGG
jgi:hypothetical protein